MSNTTRTQLGDLKVGDRYVEDGETFLVTDMEAGDDLDDRTYVVSLTGERAGRIAVRDNATFVESLPR